MTHNWHFWRNRSYTSLIHNRFLFSYVIIIITVVNTTPFSFQKENHPSGSIRLIPDAAPSGSRISSFSSPKLNSRIQQAIIYGHNGPPQDWVTRVGGAMITRETTSGVLAAISPGKPPTYVATPHCIVYRRASIVWLEGFSVVIFPRNTLTHTRKKPFSI